MKFEDTGFTGQDLEIAFMTAQHFHALEAGESPYAEQHLRPARLLQRYSVHGEDTDLISAALVAAVLRKPEVADLAPYAQALSYNTRLLLQHRQRLNDPLQRIILHKPTHGNVRLSFNTHKAQDYLPPQVASKVISLQLALYIETLREAGEKLTGKELSLPERDFIFMQKWTVIDMLSGNEPKLDHLAVKELNEYITRIGSSYRAKMDDQGKVLYLPVMEYLKQAKHRPGV